MMKLYCSDKLMSRKACAVAGYLNSPLEFVVADLGKDGQSTSAFAAINPNRKVPVLTDGDYRLWEANAIMRHRAPKAGSDLRPADAGVSTDSALAWPARKTRSAAHAVSTADQGLRSKPTLTWRQ
jgi:glutathione S-transferase